MSNQPYQSCFEQVFDVCVIGSGYAAYAAAMAMHRKGKRVLLVGGRGDLLAESGRGFAPTPGSCDTPQWRDLMALLSARNGASDNCIDGAIAEVVATYELASSNMPVLYYVKPVAAECDGDHITAMIVATKTGPRRIVARQWLDATETGELIRLASPGISPRAATTRTLSLFFQRERWPDVPHTLAAPEGLNVSLGLLTTLWPTERRLTIELPGDEAEPRRVILPVLEHLHDTMPDVLGETVMSHCSVTTYPVYAAANVNITPPANVVNAAPALRGDAMATLADRFALGLRAADQLAQTAQANVSADDLAKPSTPIEPARSIEADVVVAGAGTGGAVAAIASGRAGAKTVCVDPLAFAGGIGAGGGIHMYYFGVTGGLQTEIDQRIREVIPWFGGVRRVAGFHPDAKKLVLEQMFREAGVRFITDAMLFDVSATAGRVDHAMIATSGGPTRLNAAAWVDATGDGDLCERAGATFTVGREGDGLMHAFSQSAGRVARGGWAAGADTSTLGMRIVNYDAGWVDPTDCEDLTRGRIVAICQYLRDGYEPETRPTYIAPALGLRQGRQVVTDYVLTLADLVERRKFDDVIGFTGCHYDNHATDYEFESDEGMFWIWFCRNWRTRIACELPYGMLLPKGVDNVLLACRALGVSQDAHHCMRMQRDMQRVGEVAGDAAALAAKHHSGARDLPFAELRKLLTATHAIDLDEAAREVPFDHHKVDRGYFEVPVDEAAVKKGLADLAAGEVNESLWFLYRAGERVQPQVREALGSDDAKVSWLAAGVCAMWGDNAAEPRLIRAIESREYGFDDVPEDRRPEKSRRDVPNWMTAIALLRRCGTDACLPALDDIARQARLPLNARTTIGLTLERLAKDLVVTDRTTVRGILDRLVAGEVPDTFVEPQRVVGRIAMQGVGDHNDVKAPPADGRAEALTSTHEDHRWQLDLVVAKARRAIGLDVHEGATRYVGDPRAGVRKAFAKVMGV